jgi:hypothetical protein
MGGDATSEATVVRPRWWTLPVAGLGSLVFVVAGVAMVAVGGPGAVIGVIAILFFGGGFVVAAPRLRPGRRSLVVDGRGLEIRDRSSSLRVAWDEVDTMGVVAINRTKMTSLRLRDPDAVAERLAASGLPLRGLRAPAVARGLMRANRRLAGADLSFSWADRDRSAEDLLALFERYRAAARARA